MRPSAGRPLAPFALAALLAAPCPAQDVDFDRDVRPLLSDRCFQCHGVDANARKAGLRLDTLAGLTGAIDGRVPVVPGDPGASELVRRILSDDPQVVMPPPSSKKTLSDADRATLVAWIEQGAAFREHWAFVPPRAPAVPADDAGGWARTPIDRFVARRLAEAGLAPQPDADRETLIRRASLDLTGLPPALDDIAAFVADERPDAWERVVDRLLASPHFGERMALVWLDLARYADTNGFHHDNVRTAWPYRDWVIAAFNDGMPYDRFVVEQLAGDLLPDPTEAQRIATAFCRMHNINDEGGALDPEYRVEAIADRIETIGTALMGLTLTCARCHDHKYDPLTQDDYYSLFATFGQVEERGVYANDFEQSRAYPPRLMYADAGLKARIAAADVELARARAELAAVEPRIAAELADWEVSLRERLGIEWVDAELVDVETARGTPLERLADGSVRASGMPPDETFTFVLRTDAVGMRVVRVEALTDPAFPEGRVALSSHGNAVVSALRAEAVSVRDPAVRQAVRFAWAWADHEQPNGDFDVLNAIRGTGDGWALAGHQRTDGRDALLIAERPFGFDGGTEVRVTIECASRYGTHVVGRPRVRLARAADDLVAHVPLVESDWWMAGPFAEETFDAAFDRAHGPEAVARIDRDAKFGKVGWKHRPDVADGEAVGLSGERRAWYFAKELRAPVATTVAVSLGSDDAIRAWLDGREVLANKALRGVAPDQEQLALELSAGEHVLVVKIVNNGGPGGFYGRVEPPVDAPAPMSPLAWIEPSARAAEASAVLTRDFGVRSPTFARLDGERQRLEKERAALDAETVPVLVMQALAEPRGYHVLTRGRYDQPDAARPVAPRPPTALGGAFPDGAPHDRLGFARWLVRPEHPLTARVHVNRIWQTLFGTGLVATSENFGQQSEWPSHKDLLDWLAVTFVESGWDQKALIRRIVTSSVYRQRAVATAAALQRDPADRLLAHFPRRRLPAELVRDNALAVAGLLVDAVGGPSVRPYQPDGLWREVSIGGSSNTQVFRRDAGAALFRRSLYTFWKRTSPSPQMSTFDAPTREFCVVRRATTNTPLQALVLWNDEQFVEAARALAARVLREADDDAARVVRMFRLCTGRTPAEREVAILTRALADFVARYRDDADAARALLAVGETPVPDDLDAAVLAAWTMLGSTVLGLDETIVRD